MDDDLVSSSPDEASMPGDLPGGGELPEIELYELDGIPLAYLPTGGSTILSLSFGVGRAHEPVIRGGMTHLAEHLILTAVADRLDQALDHSNGATEPFRVSFMIRGSPQVASAFLREICQAIERPAFHRMHEEGRVLRTERMGREGPPGMSTRTIALRAGHQGIGACHLPELFLEALDEEALRDWIARHLVAGNAAIWIAGELPSDLYVSLPPGPRTPPPQVRWIPGLQTPAIASEDIPGVAASFFVQRSAAARSAFRTLEARLRKALRVDRGLGYEVGTDYVPVSADGALATAWATCLPAAAHDVERVFLEIIDDLAARGASDDELHSQYERFARDAVDPMAIPARLDSHVRDVLLGANSESLASLLDEQWRLQPSAVAAAFRQARETMVLLLPPTGYVPQRPFSRLPDPIAIPMGHARSYPLNANRKGGAPWRKAKLPSLTVGDVGVALDDGGRRLVTIPWDDAVAVLRQGGYRTLLARDGVTFTIDATEWKDGHDAAMMVDRLAPREVFLRLPD